MDLEEVASTRGRSGATLESKIVTAKAWRGFFRGATGGNRLRGLLVLELLEVDEIRVGLRGGLKVVDWLWTYDTLLVIGWVLGSDGKFKRLVGQPFAARFLAI